MTGNRIQTKTQPKQSGQGASCALPLFSVAHPGTQAYAVNAAPEHNSFSFLLPAFSLCPALGLFRNRNAKSFAARLILRFSRAMFFANKDDSKLCACDTRHATGHRLSAVALAQLGKGWGFAPPRCIPSWVPQAATETVPVSAPSARFAVVAFPGWAVCP